MNYYFLGAVWNGVDKTEDFVSNGYWEMGFSVQEQPSLSAQIKDMKVGEKVAIKSTTVQKHNLPFEWPGNKSVSKMAIKAIGTVKEASTDGVKVLVEWDADFQAKEWYFFTYRKTFWRINENNQHWRKYASKLVDFAFNGIDQDYEYFLTNWLSDVERREQAFRLWLPGQVVQTATVNSYTNCLNGSQADYSDFRMQNDFPSNTFELDDISAIESFYRRLVRTGDLALWNQAHDNSRLSAALSKYKEFLQQIASAETVIASSDILQELSSIHALNRIFYGPPGTGKTYTLQSLLKHNYTDNAITQDNQAWLLGKLEKLSWFEIIALVLLEADEPMTVPEITAHSYFQLKIGLNGRDANISQTAWSALQTHTILDSVTVKYQKRVEPTVFDKNENSTWFIVDDKRDQLEEFINLSSELAAGPDQVETVKRYEFVTFHQSYGYEEFIEGLRPVTNNDGDISYEVKAGVFKRLCKRAEADPESRYAMVIDEINRGNISKIFGELITLVEVDKRAGSENALQATLPYSGTLFSVPSNIDVIGTMNTADRSLTHIDVALRRRFDFEELRTDYSLVTDDLEGINLRHLLYAMNQRIELLLDRDHVLGHALLMKVRSFDALEQAFKTNILPLLEEYFFENWEKINQVLNNNGFIEEQKNAYEIWLGESDDYAAKSFHINEDALNDLDAYQRIYSDVNEAAFDECDRVAEV